MSHELRLGDCLDPVSGLHSLANKSVGVTLTDPPFDKKTHSRGGSVVRTDGGPTLAMIPFAPLAAAAPVANEIVRVTKRWALVFCAVRQIEEWATAFEGAGWTDPRVIIWSKPDASPQFSGDRPGHGYETIVVAHPPSKKHWNGGGGKGVYVYSMFDHASGHLHPTQKPLELIQALLYDFTDPGELVLDPYSGSCTTGVACKRLGRSFLGWEIDPGFYEVGRKRLDTAREQFQLPRLAKPRQLPLRGPGKDEEGAA